MSIVSPQISGIICIKVYSNVNIDHAQKTKVTLTSPSGMPSLFGSHKFDIVTGNVVVKVWKLISLGLNPYSKAY